MKKESFEWLKNKLKPIITISQIFEKDGLELCPAHNWSVLKLLILAQWTFVYTSIIPKHFKHYFYVDLLAGAGAIKVKETGDIIAP